ncbi:amino acid permease/ SLC12A domain-containing protein [Chytriomyces sp. MP71]|nr:amino acid permease/ SLC12A domain-containing protein [Chytriomyces sp. MP71]
MSSEFVTVVRQQDSAATLHTPNGFASMEKAEVVDVRVDKLQRRLHARHLEMIAVGGTIGTGLLLRSGGAIASAGPVGALVCYALVGLQVFGVASSIGEMATLLPVEGAFSHLPARFVCPALGFVSGWNYWLNWALTFPAEMSGIASLMGYWISPVNCPSWVWSLIYMIPIVTVNCFPVTGFAEMEFVLCIIKILAIVVFMGIGICLWFGVGNSGQGPIGFRNWNPAVVGDTPLQQFMNISNGFTTAFFSYGGTELVGLTAGEAANPRLSVPRAIRGTFYRILLFYLGAIFIVGVLLRPDDPVLSSSSIKTSPFVWVYNKAGITIGADIMNAVIIVAASSAANSSIYACARTLMRLSEDGQAPRIFSRVTAHGVPLYSVFAVVFMGLLAVVAAYASGPNGSVDIFNWLSGFISISILISWVVMSITHLRFRYGYLAQGRRMEDLPYIAPLFPWMQGLSLVIGAVVVAFMLMGAFDATGDAFFDVDWWMNDSWTYAGIPLMVVLFVVYGVSHPGAFRLVRYEDMDFESNRVTETEAEIAQVAAAHARPMNAKELATLVWFKLF